MRNKSKSLSLVYQPIASFSYRARRDNSLPSHTINAEKDEKEDASEVTDQSKNTPRRRTRTTECESLSDVQAYTMLDNAIEPIEIQS